MMYYILLFCTTVPRRRNDLDTTHNGLDTTQNVRKKNFFYLLLVVFGGFFVFGLSENIRGPALLPIRTEFGLGESQIGFLLATNSLGYLLACSFTAFLARKIGIRPTVVAAFLSMALSGWLIGLSANFAFLAASFFLLFIGNGMLEVGLGIVAARIFTKNTGAMMNLSHFFYGFGSMVAPVSAAYAMTLEMGSAGELGWRGMFPLLLALSLLPIVPALLGRAPGDGIDAGNRVSLKAIAADPAAWLIVAVLTFGVVSELSVGSWLVYYLENVYRWDTERASGMLSLFFLFFMLARLLLGPVTDRVGYIRSVMLLSAFAGACGLAAVLLGEPAAILFALAGLGIAPIYPTVMAILAKRYARGLDTALTFTVTLLGIGNVTGNVIIGSVMERFGLRTGYAVIALLAVVCSFFSLWLILRLRKRNEPVP